MMICGFFTNGAKTAFVGFSTELLTASSVLVKPSMISGSWYSSAVTCWYPTAGPPGRTSTCTPVFWPFATRSPRTATFSVSTS